MIERFDDSATVSLSDVRRILATPFSGRPSPYPSIPELPDSVRLAAEKAALGFYLSGHPLDLHRAELEGRARHRVEMVATAPTHATLTLGGLISGFALHRTKKGRMAKFLFEDFTGSIAGMAWPDTYLQFRKVLKDDFIGFIKVGVSTWRESREIVIQDMKAI